MKHTILAATAGLVLMAAPAAAAPLAMSKDVPAATTVESSIEKVHAWHSTCQLGVRGWHRHDRYRNREVCRPFKRVYRYYR